MSEITWATLIGVAGALIASAITGCISYFISRVQTNARNAELEKQLNHQEREARRNRLIATRERYLIPLREIVSKWVVALSHMANEAERFARDIKAQHRPYPFIGYKVSRESHKDTLKEIENQIENLMGDLAIARAQAYDDKLNAAIDKVFHQYLRVSIESIAMQAYQSKLKDKTIDETLETLKTASLELRGDVQQISRRIEELLVGDE